MKTLSAQYTQFTPEERARLALAAGERGDFPELERLFRSCPQMTRDIPDPRYTTRLLSMHAAVSRLLIQWVEVSAAVLLQCLLTVEGIPAEDVVVVGPANAAWKKMSAIWRGIEAGIQGFCAEAGLTCDQLLGLADGRPMFVERARRVLHVDARANRQCEKAIRQRLAQAWEVGNQQ